MHYLRTVADADRAARTARPGRARSWSSARAGSAAEVAASARQRGAGVTRGRAAARCRSSACSGREIGAVYRDVHARPRRAAAARHRRRGVRGRRRRSSGCGRTTGARSTCDLVVVGVGVAPRPARRGGRARRRRRHPRRRAAADRARPACSRPATWPAPSTLLRRRIRVEHWANALEQGPAAARNMLGARRRLRPAAVLLLRPVRRRHGVRRATPASWDRVVVRGDPAGREFIAFWLRGRPRARRHERQRLGRHGHHPAPDPRARGGRRRRLADPDVPLDEVSRGRGALAALSR